MTAAFWDPAALRARLRELSHDDVCVLRDSIEPVLAAGAAVPVPDGPLEGGETYRLTGPEAITFARVADALSAAAGRTITYVSVGDDEAQQAMTAAGIPPMVADAIVAIFADQRTGSMAGTTPALRELIGREPRTIADFARDHAGMFRAAVPATGAPRT